MRHSFSLVYFKPLSSLNPESLSLYQWNIFSEIRQLKYSNKNENSIDMVLLKWITDKSLLDLKINYAIVRALNKALSKQIETQSITLFKRCLVHFAIDTEVCYMAALN